MPGPKADEERIQEAWNLQEAWTRRQGENECAHEVRKARKAECGRQVVTKGDNGKKGSSTKERLGEGVLQRVSKMGSNRPETLGDR